MNILFYLALLSGAVYFLFMLSCVIGFLRTPVKRKSISYLSVSIIIPVRNEEDTIRQCLESLVAQDYPSELFDIHVVDDNSGDRTCEYIRDMQKKHNKIFLHRRRSNENRSFKKRAIEEGINNSKGEIVVTTDGDCTTGRSWLSTMMNYFNPSTGMVSGPVAFTSGTGFFHRFLELEFTGFVTLGAGAIGIRFPNLCNGANLSYRREAFEESGGFSGNEHLSSGDDEFLMHKIYKAGKWKIVFAKDKHSIVYTRPPFSLREFLNQRRRWASKIMHYSDPKLILLLVIIYFFYFSLAVWGIGGIFMGEMFLHFLILFFVKILSECLVLVAGTSFFRNRKLLKDILIFEFIHIPYILWAGLAGNLGHYLWKGRKTR